MLRMRLLSRGVIWSRLELSVSLTRLPLLRCQMEKSIRLAEIQTQLHDTSQSVRKGKQLLSTLSDDIAHPVRHLDSTARSPLPVPSRGQNAHFLCPLLCLRAEPPVTIADAEPVCGHSLRQPAAYSHNVVDPEWKAAAKVTSPILYCSLCQPRSNAFALAMAV